MSFRSGRARLLWGLAGVALIALGAALVYPAFRPTPDPPRPWGLWVTTDGARVPDPRHMPDALLELAVVGQPECGRPTRVTGTLHGEQLGSVVGVRRRPHQLFLSLAHARILSAEARRSYAKRWRTMRIVRFRTVDTAQVRFQDGHPGDDTLEFRLEVTGIARRAGHRACYLTSPVLFEYAGDHRTWDEANGQGRVYLDTKAPRGGDRFDYAPLTDAIVTLRVPGQLPDRAWVDDDTLARAAETVLTCSGNVPGDDGSRSDYAIWRQLVTLPSCGSVQRFQANDAEGQLNRLIFIAGLVVSVGTALLIEALVSIERPRGPAAPEA